MTPTDLLVDLGNSRMKWAWSAPGVWRTGAVDLDPDGPATTGERAWTGEARPGRAILSSVQGDARTQPLADWMKRRWSIEPYRLRSQAAQLGVRNAYHEPSSLGSDRWAALVGARHAWPGALSVVDCGSAVTVDALSDAGEFLGGVIFPGLRLLRQSLYTGTAGIRSNDGDDRYCAARSTADAVAAGTLFGLCGAIDRVIEEQRRVLGANAKVVVTGGDGPAVLARLRSGAVLEPELVLRGLARIAATLP